jgi:ABC-2 type transport system permease protein
VGVVDQDGGLLGRAITAELLRSPEVDARRLSAADASRQLADGTLSAYILFPPDFTSRTAAGHVIAPVIALEGSQPATNQAVLGALFESLGRTIFTGVGVRVSPSITYLRGGPGLDTLDYFGAAFIGLIGFFLVFVVTSVAFLRERTQGTLERLMASPLRRTEIVLGYMLGFSAVALLQGLVILAFSLLALRVHNSGSVWLLFLTLGIMTVGAVNLGIFLSMFARTEFQAVQFIPLVVVPQVILSGIVFPISSEPRALQYVSNLLPLTYAVYGMRDVMLGGAGLGSAGLRGDLAVVFAFALLMMLAASLTLRRTTA